MKKSVLLLSMILLLLVSVACGGQGGNTDVPDPVGEPATGDENEAGQDGSPDAAAPEDAVVNDEPEPAEFAFMYNDVLIKMNQNMKEVISELGEPSGYLDAPSCAFDGMDRIFSYPNIQIYTYPVGDEDFIHTIGFINDTLRTTEGGIRLGSNIDDVLNAYGDDEYEYETGMYTFKRGLTRLEFIVTDDEVRGISYRYHLDI